MQKEYLRKASGDYVPDYKTKYWHIICAWQSTTPVQALKHCERLLRRLSQHLTFSLALLTQKRGMGFPPHLHFTPFLFREKFVTMQASGNVPSYDSTVYSAHLVTLVKSSS